MTVDLKSRTLARHPGKIISSFFIHLRGGLSAICLLCLGEFVVMVSGRLSFRYDELFFSLVIFFGIAVFISVLLVALTRYFSHAADGPAVEDQFSIIWSLLLIMLFIAFHLQASRFSLSSRKVSLVGIGMGIIPLLLVLLWLFHLLKKDRIKPGHLIIWSLSLPLGLGFWIALGRTVYSPGANWLLSGAVVYGTVLISAVAALFLKSRRIMVWLQRGAVLIMSVIALSGLFRERAGELPQATADKSLPSIILITVDTLRADFSSCCGESRGQAPALPALEDLARQSVIFENAFSPSPWTIPTVVSMMTGLYPSANGSGKLNPVHQDYTGVARGETTLASLLKSAGYATAAFIGNPWLNEEHGYSQGFDLYRLCGSAGSGPRWFLAQALEKIGHLLGRKTADPNAAGLTDTVIEWLSHKPEQPFFLWVHYLDPHLPYRAHDDPHIKLPEVNQHIRDLCEKDSSPALVRAGFFNLSATDREYFRMRYRGEVVFTEKMVDRLLVEIKKNGLLDHSLIIYTSDHGEELWEHGGFEHGHTFHDEVIHVPLLIKLPDNRHSGKRIGSPVDLTHLMFTVPEAVPLKNIPPRKEQSSSLMPCIEDNACPETWLSESPLHFNDQGAIGDSAMHKAIIHEDKTVEYFNLQDDPHETAAIKTPTPAAFTRLSRELFPRIMEQNQKRGQTIAPANRQMDEETRKRLEGLGYLK